MIYQVIVALVLAGIISHYGHGPVHAQLCNVTQSCSCDPVYKQIENHTMCKFKPCDCAGRPQDILLYRNLICAEKRGILKLHNDYRQKVASGNLTTQPSARFMYKLRWSNEAERIARCYAHQCTFQHDKVRGINATVKGGQNLAIFTTITNRFKMETGCATRFTHHMKGWFDEHVNFTSSSVNNFTVSPTVMIGHYTQMVWAKSQVVGCAFVCHVHPTYRDHYIVLHVCNYYPRGNLLYKPLYEVGKPNCTAYPGYKFSTSHPALCESVESTEPLVPNC